MTAVLFSDPSPAPACRVSHCCPRWLAVGLILLGTVGCQSEPTGTIAGQVLVNGEPVPNLEVTFTLVSDQKVDGPRDGMGHTDEAGQFKLYHGRGEEEFLVGEYKVTLAPSLMEGEKAMKAQIPANLSNPDQTTLVENVMPGANSFEIEIATK